MPTFFGNEQTPRKSCRIYQNLERIFVIYFLKLFFHLCVFLYLVLWLQHNELKMFHRVFYQQNIVDSLDRVLPNYKSQFFVQQIFNVKITLPGGLQGSLHLQISQPSIF